MFAWRWGFRTALRVVAMRRARPGRIGDREPFRAGARILSAVVIDQPTVEALFADRIESRRTVSFDPATGGIQALRDRRLGAIRLSSGPDSGADPDAILAALLEAVREHGLSLLPWSDGGQALRDRAAYAGVPLDDAALLDRLDEWLAPLLVGKRRLDAIAPGALVEALRNLLGWDAMQTINRLAPPDFTSPAGSTHAIDYAAEGGPRVELRVQALFGLGVHPTIGEARVPLVLSLTSPAGRPIQTTRDLPGFWAGSWVAVAKEMRGRYPKHPWPDDPAAASATLRTKKADARGATSR
jgi:ATP-dependent helicase HrpB